MKGHTNNTSFSIKGPNPLMGIAIQIGITGAFLILEITKNTRQNETTVIETSDVRQQSRVFSEKQDTSKVSFKNFCLQKVFRLWLREKKPTQILTVSLSVQVIELEVQGKLRCLEYAEYQRRERCTQRELQRPAEITMTVMLVRPKNKLLKSIVPFVTQKELFLGQGIEPAPSKPHHWLEY